MVRNCWLWAIQTHNISWKCLRYHPVFTNEKTTSQPVGGFVWGQQGLFAVDTLNLDIYPDLLVILTCMFPRLKRDISRMEPSSPSSLAIPAFPVHFVHLGADTSSLGISWILPYSWSYYQNHKPGLISPPLGLFGKSLLGHVFITMTTSLIQTTIFYIFSLFSTQWLDGLVETDLSMWRSSLDQSYVNLTGFLLGSRRPCVTPASLSYPGFYFACDAPASSTLS